MPNESDDLDVEIESFIEDTFRNNVNVLETEQQLRLNAYVREQALLQVKLYWKKMRELALRVSKSEVPVTLSNQSTPENRRYTIHGVADIIEEENKTIIYDIKTHDPDYIKHNKEKYEAQLNIYAKIWKDVTGKNVDGTAVIATPVPNKIRFAIQEGNIPLLERSMAEWDPIIQLVCKEENVAETLAEFGRIVDCIENRQFDPVSLDVLNEAIAGGNTKFAVRICRNCDIRFACDSYRSYSLKQRSRSVDDIITLMKDLGDEKDVQKFRSLAFEEDEEKEFEASTAEIEE